jgi:hypothetical protein
MSSTSIPVGSSTPLHIIVLHHLPRPPPGPARAETSHPLPDDTPLPTYGPAVEVPIRIFYPEKFRSWWRILSFRPDRVLSYTWGWITVLMSTSTSTPASNTYSFLYLLLPGLRTPGLFSSQPAALTSSSPPFRPIRAHILTRLSK